MKEGKEGDKELKREEEERKGEGRERQERCLQNGSLKRAAKVDSSKSFQCHLVPPGVGYSGRVIYTWGWGSSQIPPSPPLVRQDLGQIILQKE